MNMRIFSNPFPLMRFRAANSDLTKELKPHYREPLFGPYELHHGHSWKSILSANSLFLCSKFFNIAVAVLALVSSLQYGVITYVVIDSFLMILSGFDIMLFATLAREATRPFMCHVHAPCPEHYIGMLYYGSLWERCTVVSRPRQRSTVDMYTILEKSLLSRRECFLEYMACVPAYGLRLEDFPEVKSLSDLPQHLFSPSGRPVDFSHLKGVYLYKDASSLFVERKIVRSRAFLVVLMYLLGSRLSIGRLFMTRPSSTMNQALMMLLLLQVLFSAVMDIANCVLLHIYDRSQVNNRKVPIRCDNKETLHGVVYPTFLGGSPADSVQGTRGLADAPLSSRLFAFHLDRFFARAFDWKFCTDVNAFAHPFHNLPADVEEGGGVGHGNVWNVLLQQGSLRMEETPRALVGRSQGQKLCGWFLKSVFGMIPQTMHASSRLSAMYTYVFNTKFLDVVQALEWEDVDKCAPALFAEL
jgi:hypothetical protein